MIEPYTAVGLIPTFWGIRRREDIEKNLEHIEGPTKAAFWLANLDIPVRLVAIPEGGLQGFSDDILDVDHAEFTRTCAIDIPGPETDRLGTLARTMASLSRSMRSIAWLTPASRLAAEGVRFTALAASVKLSARPAATKIATARSEGRRDVIDGNANVSPAPCATRRSAAAGGHVRKVTDSPRQPPIVSAQVRQGSLAMRTPPVVADRPSPQRGRRYGRSIDILRELVADTPLPEARPDGPALHRRLVRLEQQITRGRAQFARQLEVVAGIERRQGDSTSAREMLQLFAQAHAIRLDDRDRLARLLEGALD